MKGKTYPVQSRINIQQAELLKKAAEQKGLSLSMLVRIILINYIEGTNK